MMKLNLQYFAHKKGVGSTKNGRDSESKRLGAKRADGQFVKAGNILYRTALSLYFRKGKPQCLQTEQKYLSDPVKAGTDM